MNSPRTCQAALQTRPPLHRMMQIHRAIQSAKFPNATSLARELEVSTKTVHRDLEFMRLRLELPIEYDGVRFGFYYTEDVKAFPTVQITEGELFALVVAEKALQQYRGTSFEKPLLSAIRKMEQSLPETISLSLDDIQNTISFRTRAEPILDLEVFNTLTRATAECQQLELLYRKPGQSQPERRVIDPYHLANINGEWYLFAYDQLRKAIRTFVPARINQVRRTGKSFVRPNKFSVDKQLRDSFGVRSGDGQFEVVIRFDAAVADYIREKRWHASQAIRELRGGQLELSLRLSSLAEVERWILGWGGNARVVRPAELAGSVRQAAEKILKMGTPK